MAINLNNLEPTKQRWNAPTIDYPQGSFKNGTGQGKRDGSYAKAEWANDIFGFFGALLKNGDQKPNGQVETARNSQIYDAMKAIIKKDISVLGGDPTANASGNVNAITATFTKPVSLEDGKRVQVRASGANTSATVTFNPNSLGAKPIVKGDGSVLAIGDIASAGFWMTLIYDATLQKWILQNPATGVKSSGSPNATESNRGIIQIASTAEVANGTDNTKAVTPKTVNDNYLKKNDASNTYATKSSLNSRLPLSGGNMTGNIDMGSYSVGLNGKWLSGSSQGLTYGGKLVFNVQASTTDLQNNSSPLENGKIYLVY